MSLKHLKAGDTVFVAEWYDRHREGAERRGRDGVVVTKVGRDYLHTEVGRFRRDNGAGRSDFHPGCAYLSREAWQERVQLESRAESVARKMGRLYDTHLQRLTSEELDTFEQLIDKARTP